ncbi:MAG: prepilin-type N-terminal cleavage/methylation domain-containing protein [Elusimicrobia bacterium]|nr:prepilin-type N-terminal cleavage/methylation domain-containing protein [Elusimicrobiota bacterium]
MRRARGFTLIELMIVVAIIGVLAAIVTPKFSQLVRKSREGSSKGNLSSIRSALAIYYGDQEGLYPANIAVLTAGSKWLSHVPDTKTPDYHPASPMETDDLPSNISDVGGWLYDNDSTDAMYGQVIVNCTHTDSKGSVWSLY